MKEQNFGKFYKLDPQILSFLNCSDYINIKYKLKLQKCKYKMCKDSIHKKFLKQRKKSYTSNKKIGTQEWFKEHTTLGEQNWSCLGVNLTVFGLIATESEKVMGRLLEKGRDATGLATTIFSASLRMVDYYRFINLLIPVIDDWFQEKWLFFRG